jgi:hypothetical protein
VTIDPLISLSFSLQSNKGAYALLVGSGVSRPAGIPTGWEITLEMVRKIAASSATEIEASPESWYLETYKREPDYSELLDQLCKSGAERQQYLKPFFEPTDGEREEGLKQPTAAHHAIADLMAGGYVRVVITTNFDRLLEQALEAKGIVPVVVANADQARGMLPLVHQKHCIIKVHGDYLDTRIMNTASELELYTPEIDRLLDRVFDEFGMIICGWSGAWDPALRNAIVRAPSRRFSSYWASRGNLNGEAEKIVTERGIVPIQIDSADGFFPNLAEKLASLREFDRPHPLSIQSAIASLKRYLAEDRYRIRLHDLLMGSVEDARSRWNAAGLELNSPQPSDETIIARVKAYDASMEVLLPLAAELGKWARKEHIGAVCETLEALCSRAPIVNGSYNLWRELSRYPATLFLYSVGISALRSKNFELIGQLLSIPIRDAQGEEEPAVSALLPMCVVDKRESLWPLFEGQRRHTPLSDWLEMRMRALLAPNSVAEQYRDPFVQIFDEFEMISAVVYRAMIRSKRSHLWVPFGCWGWRRSGQEGILESLRTDLSSKKEQSKLMKLGVFHNGSAEATEVLGEVLEFANKLHLR